MMINENTTLSELFLIVKRTLNELNPGEEFIVKDLFKGFQWNRIPRANRIKLGSMMLNFANHEGAIIIKALDKTPQNQQRYKRI